MAKKLFGKKNTGDLIIDLEPKKEEEVIEGLVNELTTNNETKDEDKKESEVKTTDEKLTPQDQMIHQQAIAIQNKNRENDELRKTIKVLENKIAKELKKKMWSRTIKPGRACYEDMMGS
jgi:predicted RNase H-like nuclease (RuvC/YqgF family)